MYLESPKCAVGDGFRVHAFDREYIAYEDARNQLLIGAEYSPMMMALYDDLILDRHTRKPAVLRDISLDDLKDRVAAGVSLMGVNCGWVR